MSGGGIVCICVIACVFILFLTSRIVFFFFFLPASFVVECSIGEWIRGRHRCSASACCVCCAGKLILSLFPTFRVDGERLAQGMHVPQ